MGSLGYHSFWSHYIHNPSGEMKAKELRIGNYVAEYECDPFYFQVEQISDLWVYYRSGSIKTKEPNPIPLTEEWLVSFGFEKRESSSVIWFIDSFTISQGVCDDFWFGVIKIQYVHQLQNLYFALTGEELTIR